MLKWCIYSLSYSIGIWFPSCTESSSQVAKAHPNGHKTFYQHCFRHVILLSGDICCSYTNKYHLSHLIPNRYSTLTTNVITTVVKCLMPSGCTWYHLPCPDYVKNAFKSLKILHIGNQGPSLHDIIDIPWKQYYLSWSCAKSTPVTFWRVKLKELLKHNCRNLLNIAKLA